MNYENILNEARTAAAAAVKAAGPENTRAFNCGFAWVTIDGMSGLARWCRTEKNKLGGNDYSRTGHLGSKGYPRGWQFWNPGDFAGQDVSIKEKGAIAFRDVLAKHGIVGTVGSRLD